MTGRTLSHFEIQNKLGEGGMGVVYKARDTQLNRAVAIKLLAATKIPDDERRQRFLQEARAASALNHPNIVTVHEIGKHEDADFIAMEFIDGRTLDQCIPRRGMRLGDALKAAVQIADAMARAHAAGIVHRDLKPGNVMITEEGRVKVLDFGLAKLTESQPPADETLTAAPKTEEGTVMGTAGYMSPEQAEGKQVDARSDIFSFGALLYEMLTGHRAFQRDSRTATLAAVLREEPKAIGELNPAVPRELEKLVARCLRKDPARRAQHMADLKLALEEFKEESETSLGPAAVPKSFNRLWILGAAGVLLAAGYLLFTKKAAPETAMVSTVLTSYSGIERNPALSPDGKYVAFSWNGEKEDNFDIYVLPTDGGTPVRLTTNEGFDGYPKWSRDGRFLVFHRMLRDTSGTFYVLQAIGGQERKVMDTPVLPSRASLPTADWANDGKSVYFTDNSARPSTISQWSLDTGEKVTVTSPPPQSFGDAHPLISPDGAKLAFRRSDGDGVGHWHVLSMRAPQSSSIVGRVSQLDGSYTGGAAWTPDSNFLVVSGTTGGQAKLFRFSVAGSLVPQPVALADADARDPTISAQGARLAYTRAHSDTNIWKVDLGTPSAEPVRIIASTRREYSPDFSPDGSKILFCSARSGSMEIWVSDADGGNPLQVTQGAVSAAGPRWSPDGRLVVYAERPNGNADVYIVSAQGGKSRRLTTNPANDASAYFSRDGKSIYFVSSRTGRSEIWKMPADGAGPEVQITRNSGWRSRESIDAKYLYFQRWDGPGLWRLPVSGGEDELIADMPAGTTWDLTNGSAYFYTPGFLNRFDLTTRTASVPAPLPPRTQGGPLNFSISPDGRWLAFVRGDQNISDLMLVNNFR